MNRTEAQQRAVTSMQKTLCVDAGAGSGKTRVLIERIVYLIEEQNADLDEIVAITFTDKAAAEMKTRLRQAFRMKAPLDSAEGMTRWRDLERRVETARIGTIHSFCGNLLREHALHIGTDPDFAVMAEAETALLRNETVSAAVTRLLDLGDPAALRTATEFGTSALIRELDRLLARRGTLERLESNLPLREPAALAERWSEIVQREYEERLLNFAQSRDVNDWIDQLGSFDGLCLKASDGREIQRQAILKQLVYIRDSRDMTQLKSCIEEIISAPAGHPSSKNWESPETFENVKKILDTIKKRMEGLAWTDPDPAVESLAAQLTCDLFSLLEHASKAYKAAKAARAALDFDDLIASTWRILHDNTDVRKRVARGIRFLLVDEFQDTDWIQLDIVRMLSDEPGGPDWFFVGDAKQSIYDFRGAEVEVFQQQRVASRETIPMAQNFRTVPEIIAFVNDLFTCTGILEAVETEYKALEPHRPPANETRIAFLVPPEREEKANVETYRRDEADLIAWRIEEMCAGPHRAMVESDGEARPARFGDVAILLRSFSDIHLYEEALRKRSIPFGVVSGKGFYERQEILDLRNLLTVVVDPWNEMALLGFLRGPLACLSDNALAAMQLHGGLARVFWSEEIPAQFPETDSLKHARSLIEELRGKQDLPLAAFMRHAIELAKHEAILLGQFHGARKAWNIRKAANLAEDFARTQPARLPAFVQYLDTLADRAIREGDAVVEPKDAVTLMTVHKAKGLEFPIVVLADSGRQEGGSRPGFSAFHRDMGLAVRVTGNKGETIQPSIYKTMRNASGAKETAEHARVLYVGMTRARDWLLFGGTPKPGKGSWLAIMNDAYHLLDRRHGEFVETETWKAIVWREAAPPASASEESRAAVPVNVAAIVRQAEPIVSVPSRRTISVSTLLNMMTGMETDDEPSREPYNGFPALSAMERGTLVHRLFEVWSPGERMDIEAFLLREAPMLHLRETLAADLDAILKRFESGALARRMAAAKRIEREAPFLLRIGATIVSGTIDALIDRTLIVDFKTGRIHAEMHERYEYQIHLYAAAVQALLGHSPTEALLYYADLGEECAVDVSPPRIREALERAEAVLANDVEQTGIGLRT
ncbi:MAG TPA: UvrD-helicase domain-containing protein [Candidatus Hydrogenedentes bacterium]|nr:UvrD-helicase domain-containing protein [Candidatus Hydrogenedentota bacterium]